MIRTILLFTSLLLAPISLHAAGRTLSGSGGTAAPGLAWGTAGNWSPAGLPGVADNAVVGATGLVDVRGSTLGGASQIQDLAFTGAAAVTLHNNSSSTAMVLSLNGGRGAGVPLIACTGNVARTIAGPGTNATPQTLGLQLKASGRVDVTAGTLSISARISDDGTARQLTKTGAGTLVLSGRNSYSGGTVVSAGVLDLNGASAGNGRVDGSVTVSSGAELRVTGGDGTGLGYNSGNKVDALDINGGLVSAAAVSHLWKAAVTMTGGELRSNGGVSSAATTSYFDWGSTTLTTNASAGSAVVSGRVRLRNEASSTLTLNVADGAAADDLLISAALTQSGGKCGLVKKGDGTLRLTGEVLLGGVLTVEAGTLDVSTATLGPDVQFNVSNRAFLRLPATSAHKVFIAGEKLAAGTWGPPGSVAAGAAANESPIFTGAAVTTLTNTEPSARERWKTMHYGLFVHYVWGGSGQETRRMDGSPTGSLEEVANGFDAAGFADDLESAGAEYVIFTAWHSNFIPLFNSSAVVNNFGFQRNSSRDVVGDMVAAVRAKGIRVLLYANIGQVSVFYDNRWNDVMEDIFSEMLDRYDIDGFFMDENDPGGNMSWDFPRIARAIHQRKPDAVTIQNFYGNLYTWDGAVGESGPADVNLSNDIMWTANSPYAQVIAQTWSAQVAKVPTPTPGARRSAEGIYRGTVVAAGSRTEGGGIMWSAGPYPGNGTWLNPATNQTEFVGRWEPGVLEAMQGAGAYIAPVAEAIKGVRPSNSWRPQGWIGDLQWGVATRKPDDTREYIHVLKPQPTRTLKLPPPNDGKIFTNARLLPSGNPVTLVQTPRGVTLTLGAADNWNALNTVIAMDVAAQGGRGLTNADSIAVSFTGSSWSWLKNRGLGEYGDDAHVATANGDACVFSFDGTDVDVIASRGPTRGTMEVFVDGASQGIVNLNAAAAENRTTVFSKTGLARGAHTLRLVKLSGGDIAVDAFRVTELIDSSEAAPMLGALSNYNNTQTTPNGVGHVVFGANWNYQIRDWTEYNGDIHWAQWDGSEATIHFTGTGVVWEGNTQGVVDFYLDGVFMKQTNMGALGGRSNQVGYEVNGLPFGNHTLRFVKVGGVYVEFDNFRVYNAVNDHWTDSASSGALNGSIATTPANEDMLLMTFNGHSADILARENSSPGTTAVALNGQTIAAGQYNGVPHAQSPFFSTLTTSLLAPGTHTLRMTKKRGPQINFDAVRVYKQWPSAVLRWQGDSGSNFNNPANWLENDWAEWNVYVFDANAASGAVAMNGTFGSGDWHLLSGLTRDITVNGPNPLIMAAAQMTAWQLPHSTGNIRIAADSRNLRINTKLQSSGPVHWDAGAGRTLTLTGVMENWNGNASLVKIGDGTAVLGAANTYTGPTTVNAGTLTVNGSTASGSAVSVATGATLAGSGSVAGPATIAGTHSPGGTSVAILTHSGSLNYAPTSQVVWQLNSHLAGSGSGTAYDRVAARAVTADAGAAIHITLNAPGSTVNFTNTFWDTARSWNVINHTSRTGTFTLGTITTDPGGRSHLHHGTFALNHTASSVALTWTPGTPLENWRLTHFGTTANTGTAADTFDANNDGEVNLLEFATGQNPHAATLTMPDLVKNGATLEFTCTRASAALAEGLIFTVEWSDTLAAGSWSSAGVTQQILSDNGILQTVRASLAAGMGPKRFLHLKVTAP